MILESKMKQGHSSIQNNSTDKTAPVKRHCVCEKEITEQKTVQGQQGLRDDSVFCQNQQLTEVQNQSRITRNVSSRASLESERKKATCNLKQTSITQSLSQQLRRKRTPAEPANTVLQMKYERSRDTNAPDAQNSQHCVQIHASGFTIKTLELLLILKTQTLKKNNLYPVYFFKKKRIL